MTPDLSVIIPVYNRGELIRYTLESVRRASAGLKVEVIVVDDGSAEPAADAIRRLGFAPDRMLRQDNAGLLFARLAGLAVATGAHTLFLDSDDLVGPDKFRRQLAEMQRSGAEVSYTDGGTAVLEGDYDALRIEPEAGLRATAEAADFYLRIQPAPHSPIFATDYLRRVVAEAYFPPSPLYNSVAEIWFYHNAAPRPGHAVHVSGPHTIVGRHPGVRLTNHWERLGVASLAVMEAFARNVPSGPKHDRARQLVGEVAFRSWRRLPRGFSAEVGRRHLDLWRRLAPAGSVPGGPWFRRLARVLGPERAHAAMTIGRGRPYREQRTIGDDDLQQLLAALPAP